MRTPASLATVHRQGGNVKKPVLRRNYFFDEAEDHRMEGQNKEKWEAMVKIIAGADEKCDMPNRPWDVLDIGCHTGGLLLALWSHFNHRGRIKSLTGVEPLARARAIAERFPRSPAQPRIKTFARIDQVKGKYDLIVSHETLYLIPDLPQWFVGLKKLLRPAGGAFLALGSHSENIAWLRWKDVLRERFGHESYVYPPLAIAEMAHAAGFYVFVRRLMPEVIDRRYTPLDKEWGEFESIAEMLDFPRQKILYELWHRNK